MKIINMTPDFLMEVSWEVCNLVGGIYTVLSTKAKTLHNQFKDNLIFVGPDFTDSCANPYFIESDTLLKDWREHVLSNAQLKVRVGRWNIPGQPIAVLVDYKPFYSDRDKLYYQIWQLYDVNSIHANGDYDESCVFAFASAKVIESYYNYVDGSKYNFIAHFDEWTTGMGALYIKSILPSIAVVFTTHATSIGRSIAGNNKPLYDYFEGYNGDQMSRELNMEAKHSLEKQTACYSDCFTTVSQITARECEQLLKKAPDVVTPNGFELEIVPTGSKYDQKRDQARAILRSVAEALTGCELPPDTLFIATAGRYEYKNKGIDLFLDSLGQANTSEKLQKQVVAFIMVPADSDSPRGELLSRLHDGVKYRKAMHNPYLTHNLRNFHYDSVVSHIIRLQIHNKPEDKVKVIFVPSYLTGSDGIFNKSYYDILIGMDATFFPSYYEPWGYTPLESIAFSVPTLTTDLSGFGLWALSCGKGSRLTDGVRVLHRTDSNREQLVSQMVDEIAFLTSLSEAERLQTGAQARELAEKAQWEYFIENYLKAYHIALCKVKNK